MEVAVLLLYGPKINISLDSEGYERIRFTSLGRLLLGVAIMFSTLSPVKKFSLET